MSKKVSTNELELNLSQLEAVEHVKGPCMVIAGPGSGKTAVIAERLRRLTEEKRVPGKNILVVTFTRDAAEEMKKRYLSMTEAKRTDITFGTFHSIFYRMVTEAYGLKPGCVADPQEQYRILKEIIIKEKLDAETEPEILEGILSDISKVKTSDLDPDTYRSANCSKEVFGRIFRKYREYLLKNDRIDFDDMLVRALDVLREMPDLCTYWQEKYKYILIDEFQDINLLQYEIISILSQPEENVFCVGDDDQSIYGFRGAAPDLMKRFLKDHVDCPKKNLSHNYRCGENITAVAAKLMQGVKDREAKNIVSGTGEAGSVVIKRYKNRE
ncbi:MAG: ATP-dependent helicase, partial [Lachnospiraceae bacterium]|nr:ATP-dependent helicase [Lachnospiraceae bacterium]